MISYTRQARVGTHRSFQYRLSCLASCFFLFCFTLCERSSLAPGTEADHCWNQTKWAGQEVARPRRKGFQSRLSSTFAIGAVCLSGASQICFLNSRIISKQKESQKWFCGGVSTWEHILFCVSLFVPDWTSCSSHKAVGPP